MATVSSITEAIKAIESTFGSLREFVKAIESGRSMSSLARKAGVSNYYARQVLVDAGGTVPPSPRAQNFKVTMEQLKDAGWDEHSLRRAYVARGETAGSLVSKLQAITPDIDEKQLSKILKHYDIRKNALPGEKRGLEAVKRQARELSYGEQVELMNYLTKRMAAKLEASEGDDE